MYLSNRATKGFNTVQAVCLAEMDGLNTPNRYGHRPLIDNDPTRLNEPYWEHVDWCVEQAANKGLYVAMLPTWGDKVTTTEWGIGPVIFNPENAFAYGKIVASRYRDVDSIIWVNGGDRNPGAQVEVWNALAAGLIEGDGGKSRLMTFHPQGGESSSKDYHKSEWLDFNMMQSGHNNPTTRPDRMVDRDWQLEPAKPVLDGEPRYENHPSFQDGSHPYFDEHDVRRAAYLSAFAGGCGITYGCHAMWQFYADGLRPVNNPLGYWTESLDLPGASQVCLLKALMLSLPFAELMPDQSILKSPAGACRALRTSDSSHLVIYLTEGLLGSIQLNLIGLPSTRQLTWFNPRTGDRSAQGLIEPTPNFLIEKPGGPRRGTDMVLLIEPLTEAVLKPLNRREKRGKV